MLEGLAEALEREREAVLVEIAVAAFPGRTEAGVRAAEGSDASGSLGAREGTCERVAE